MSYDPSTTQKLKRRASDTDNTDRHRLNDMLWKALENHDTAVEDHEKRLTGIESTIKALKWVLTTVIALVAVIETWFRK